MNNVLADRYRFEAELARGAAGTVHRARDLITGEAVAVKMLHSEVAAEPAIVNAFIDEAEVLTQLDHPAIVRPRDFIVDGKVLALIMDLVDGVDLRRRILDDGPLAPAAAATLVMQIADPLAAVHQAGIVHGDIKPSNILVPADGTPVRLIDFGVARKISCPDAPTHGTPEYTAPEVVDGNPSTPQADVYGIGLVLYEALTAHSAYRGGSIDDVLKRHRECVPARPNQVPGDLWSVIESCLQRDPAGRPTLDTLVSTLRRLQPTLADVPLPTTGQPPVWVGRFELPAAQVPDRSAAETGMRPPMLHLDVNAERERGRRPKVPMLVGAAAGVAVLALAGLMLLGGGGDSSDSNEGVIAENAGEEQAQSSDPGSSESDLADDPAATDPNEDSTPAEEPSDPGTTDPNEDTGAEDNGSDSSGDQGPVDDGPAVPQPGDQNSQDIPGGDLIGSEIPRVG